MNPTGRKGSLTLSEKLDQRTILAVQNGRGRVLRDALFRVAFTTDTLSAGSKFRLKCKEVFTEIHGEKAKNGKKRGKK